MDKQKSIHGDAAQPSSSVGVSQNLVARFWERVNRTNGCWPWTAYTVTGGYGAINGGGIRYLAHRLSWEIHNGQIPKGQCVLHHCDNPPCVRPDHLFLGSKHDNNVDMTIKERSTIRLSNAQVVEARSLHAEGTMGYRKLAKYFGVSRSGIKDIINRKRRAHV